jgi:hypothetical protein
MTRLRVAVFVLAAKNSFTSRHLNPRAAASQCQHWRRSNGRNGRPDGVVDGHVDDDDNRHGPLDTTDSRIPLFLAS